MRHQLILGRPSTRHRIGSFCPRYQVIRDPNSPAGAIDLRLFEPRTYPDIGKTRFFVLENTPLLTSPTHRSG